MKVPHPIPYQGSKRHMARHILAFFPYEINTLVEPFAGSAALSIAAACYGKASRFHLNDINEPLVALWSEIIHAPQSIAEQYEHLWVEQQGRERAYYDHIRAEFNRARKPAHLLYLLARCVKASVRYNPRGEFNQSPDNRRSGRNPRRMADDIFAVSNLFRGRITLTSWDYQEVLQRVTERDLIYMDPPYQGVCNNRDPRYYGGIESSELVFALAALNQRRIPFIISYDGRTGNKSFGKELSPDLKLHRIEIEAGRSSQSTLLGINATTYESIYLSPALMERLDLRPQEIVGRIVYQNASQLPLCCDNSETECHQNPLTSK